MIRRGITAQVTPYQDGAGFTEYFVTQDGKRAANYTKGTELTATVLKEISEM